MELIKELEVLADLNECLFALKRIGNKGYWQVQFIMPDIGLVLESIDYDLEKALKELKEKYNKSLKERSKQLFIKM